MTMVRCCIDSFLPASVSGASSTEDDLSRALFWPLSCPVAGAVIVRLSCSDMLAKVAAGSMLLLMLASSGALSLKSAVAVKGSAEDDDDDSVELAIEEALIAAAAAL